MAIAALIVSIVAIIITSYVARLVGGSGFRAQEQLKIDLVNLLAALRSTIIKGIAASQDDCPRSLTSEIAVFSNFQTSVSGIALAGWAAEKGVGEGQTEGSWRALELRMAELAGASPPSVSEDNLLLRGIAADVELTIQDLSSKDVRTMAKRVHNLPGFFATLRVTRSKDMILRIWFTSHIRKVQQSDPKLALPELRRLLAEGRKDPNIDMWISLATNDNQGLKEAIDNGANIGASLESVLRKYGPRPIS